MFPTELKIFGQRAHISKTNQTFHYTRGITPKRVTSLRCSTPRHSAKAPRHSAKAAQLLATVCNAV